MSFDSPAANKAFRDKQGFPFSLLSDVDRTVGDVYGAKRAPDEQWPDFPKRVSFLIDPQGIVRRTYEVADPGGHAEVVLADLDELTG
jgi:peroxiredoxin Q/BCP